MTESPMNDALEWRVRHFVYAFFVENTRPPTVDETAAHFGVTVGEAIAAYEWLNENHALLLETGTHEIRMAWPLSARSTPFRANVNGRWLYANCAWDMLGIPVMLRAEATIEAQYAYAGEATTLTVVNGKLRGDGVAHFLVPFARWHDDVVHT